MTARPLDRTPHRVWARFCIAMENYEESYGWATSREGRRFEISGPHEKVGRLHGKFTHNANGVELSFNDGKVVTEQFDQRNVDEIGQSLANQVNGHLQTVAQRAEGSQAAA